MNTIPFSEGPRAYLGRRFAQIEICVVLARIFCEYTVELVLDSDGPKSWEDTRINAIRELSGRIGFVMGIENDGEYTCEVHQEG